MTAEPLRSLSQILLHGQFYANWVGFENGAFLSYLQEGVLDPKYTVQFQPTGNHSCPYNYTTAAWDQYMDVPASGRAAVPAPFTTFGIGKAEIPSRCVETYIANAETGRPGTSLLGEPYDCRNRGWYYGQKNVKPHRKWSSMFFDSATNEPAFAYCEPLLNLSSSDPSFGDGLNKDKHGMVGVACTSLAIQALSTALLSQFGDLATGGSGTFIVERGTGLLVAASSSDKDAYFDTVGLARQPVSASPSDVIRFAAAAVQSSAGADAAWADAFQTVAWVNDTDASTYPMLTVGDAYFVSSSTKLEVGISWDIVVVQKVSCPAGTYVDKDTLICAECIAPAHSSGGSPEKCDECTFGYFFKSKTASCKTCPEGATCDGVTSEANMVIKEGYWRSSSKSPNVYECPLEDSACLGGNVARSYCKEGYTGPLCNVCDGSLEYFFESSSRQCILCDGASDSIFASAFVTLLKVVLVFLGIVILFGAWGYLASKNPDNTWLHERLAAGKLFVKQLTYVYEHSIKTKTVLWAVQVQIVVEIASNCSVVFPSAIGKTLTSFSIFNFQFTQYLALPCWGSSGGSFDYIDDMLYMTMMPLAFFGALVSIYQGRRWAMRAIFSSEAEKDKTKNKKKRMTMLAMPEELDGKFSSLELDTLKRVFAHLDKDGNGSIAGHEFAKTIKDTWEDLDAKNVSRASVTIFEELDVELGGEVTFAQFISAQAKAKEDDMLGKSNLSVLTSKVVADIHRKHQSRIVQIALIVSFTILIGTSASLFNYFKCVKYDTVTVLSLDYAVDCDSTRYKGFIAYAVIMVILSWTNFIVFE
jgi:hypothetical protein